MPYKRHEFKYKLLLFSTKIEIAFQDLTNKFSLNKYYDKIKKENLINKTRAFLLEDKMASAS